MRPSYRSIKNAIEENKFYCLLILLFSIIQAGCETGLIIFTYYTLAFIQNNSIQNASETFKLGNTLLNYLNNIGLKTDIILFLSMMILFGLIQSISIYLERINIAKICA